MKRKHGKNKLFVAVTHPTHLTNEQRKAIANQVIKAAISQKTS